ERQPACGELEETFDLLVPHRVDVLREEARALRLHRGRDLVTPDIGDGFARSFGEPLRVDALGHLGEQLVRDVLRRRVVVTQRGETLGELGVAGSERWEDELRAAIDKRARSGTTQLGEQVAAVPEIARPSRLRDE